MEDTSMKAVLENVLGNFVYDSTTHDKKERLLQVILTLQLNILQKLDKLLEKENK